MKLRRQSLLTEPPASAASDIAFILIIFFLVCASVEPEEGRQQIIPKNEQDEKKQKTKTINVDITPSDVIVNVPNSRDGRPTEQYSQVRCNQAMRTGHESQVPQRFCSNAPWSHWHSDSTVLPHHPHPYSR